MKKIFYLILLTGIHGAVNATACACGSMEAGFTITNSIADSPGVTPDCCKGLAIGYNDSYKFKWKKNTGGTYTLVGSTTYATGAEAQSDCCPQAT